MINKQFNKIVRAMLLCAASILFGVSAHADELKPFAVTYIWKWHGITVATSSLELKRMDAETWAYSSKSEPKGLLAAARSERPTQLSIVRIQDDSVQPLSYKAEDGTSATDRDADLKYDWQAHRVSGVYNDVPVSLSLQPGTHDDLSAQLSMFVQLIKGKAPVNSFIIDKNSVREYHYVRERDETIATSLGQIATTVYRSEREGSHRVTRFWCAPSKGFLPMRVEQKKDDSVEWTMEIRSLRRDE